MNWYWIIYLFTILDNFIIVFGWAIGLSIVGLIITSIFRLPASWNNNEVQCEGFLKRNKITWITCFIVLLTSIFFVVVIPSKKDMALIIIGGAVGEFVENDENVKKLPSELFMLLRKEILEEISELPEDVKKEVKHKLGVEDERDQLMKMSKERLIEMLEEKEMEN